MECNFTRNTNGEASFSDVKLSVMTVKGIEFIQSGRSMTIELFFLPLVSQDILYPKISSQIDDEDFDSVDCGNSSSFALPDIVPTSIDAFVSWLLLLLAAVGDRVTVRI